MKILAIGSHPDDLEYGCGGTMARYAQAGHQVTMLVITCGEQGGAPGTREAEARAAAAVLGSEIIFGEFEDTRVTLDQPFIAYLESQLDKLDPDIIFVHHGSDTHQEQSPVRVIELLHPHGFRCSSVFAFTVAGHTIWRQ